MSYRAYQHTHRPRPGLQDLVTVDVEVFGIQPAFACLEEVHFCFEEGDETSVKGIVTGGQRCVEVR